MDLLFLENPKSLTSLEEVKLIKSVILLFIREDISELQQLRDFLLKKSLQKEMAFMLFL